MNKKAILSKLRQEVYTLKKQRECQEKIIFRREPMIPAAFCRRENGSCYLSASIEGKSRHRYVRRIDELYWRKRTLEWKNFSEAMAEWVRINKEIEKKLREIGRLRQEKLPNKKKRGNRNGAS